MTILSRSERFHAAFFALFALTSITSAAAHAEDGVTADKILIGSGTPMSGANKGDGDQRVRAHKALVKKVNASGGILGRKLEILDVDNAYDPKASIEAAHEMIDKKKVFAIYDFLGTPTTAAVMPFTEAQKVPLFAPITGADFVRQPVHKYVFPVRPPFSQEADALVDYAVATLGSKEIGVFYQDDALGQVGRSSTVRALGRHGLKPAGFGSHPRNSTSVEAGIDELIKVDPKVVILWTINPSAIAFLKKAAEKNFHPVFIAASPTNPKAVQEEALKAGEGMVFASGYPLETDTSVPIVKEYRDAMAAAGYKPEEMSSYGLETYFNGALLVEALKRSGKELTREKLVSTLESLNEVDVGGLRVTYSPTDHRGLGKVYLTQLKGGKIAAIN